MRGQLLNSLYTLVFTFLCLGSLLATLTWHMFDNNDDRPHRLPQHKKSPADLCIGCKVVMKKVKERYFHTWKEQANYTKFRFELSSQCNGFDEAIITQANTPIGSKLVYDINKGNSLQVTPKIFKTFVKEHPFQNKTWETCAVVGNGGILTDSGCGKMIDSAQFVIRCNLPPLEDSYERDVGTKTDLVTANQSILKQKYQGLIGRRRRFVENLRSYGNSLLLLSAFNSVCQRALYSIEELESPIRPVFLNPVYIQKLSVFWRSQGIKAARLSTGIMMTSLALELCDNVHLYGFWPFGNHPQGLYALTNHYYDDAKVNARVHTMPAEFELLLQLHSQGVLRLHLEDCRSGKMYGALNGHRRPFVESLSIYGSSLLLLPAFSFAFCTPLCMRVLYSIEDFKSPIRPVFLNPDYLQKLAVFWRSQGIKDLQLSTGIMMTSLALEICDNVHLYGFWPFLMEPAKGTQKQTQKWVQKLKMY